MPCHSEEFTLDVLNKKAYSCRISPYMKAQILRLDCDELTRLLRAMDAFEDGMPREKCPGSFNSNGQLAGYGHFHWRTREWVKTNFAGSQGMPIQQPLADTLEKVANKMLSGGQPPTDAVDAVMKKFQNRVITGDWVVYCTGAAGTEFLMLSEHVDRGSKAESELRQTLDQIAKGTLCSPQV